MLLNNVLSITFKPNERVFLGWKIRQFNNIHIQQINNDLLDELSPPQEHDYQIKRTKNCRNVRYILREGNKNYKYCSNTNDIYLDSTNGFFLPVFNFSKRLLKMERYSLEKPSLPSFLELQADKNITNVAKRNSSILFDTSKYQIKCKTPACHSIKIADKKKGTTRSLKDEVSEEMFKLSTSEKGDSFKFYEASTDSFKMGRYLRVDYSITGFVSIIGEGREEKHVLENCAIIDLQTAQVKEVASARDEICYIDDYLSKVRFTFFKPVPVYIGTKTYLYKSPNKPTKMYLIKGDKVTLLDEKTDNSGQKWYFINYKGKKDLNMWIKAEAIDIEHEKETTQKPEQEIKPSKSKELEQVPQTKIQTAEPIDIAKQELITISPKNAEIIKAEKAEPIEKSASGSISLTFLASLFGLLVWRVS